MSVSCDIWAIDSDNTADFPKLASLYEDNYLEVCATVSAKLVPNDYGVPGSPVWCEIDDAKADTISVNGTDYTPKGLAAKFGNDIADILEELCIEAAIEKDAWE
jgi:hypothetical protein